jgi:hypothetical protein
LGPGLEQIETLIANITISKEPQKLIDTANQIAQITIIPLDKIPNHIKRQQDELQKLDEEIEKAGAILEQKNIDIQIIEEFKKLEEGLQKYGLCMESPRTLVSVLQMIKQLGYNPRKLESHTNRYQEIIHLCEQLISLEIGFTELSTFHAAIFKKIEVENLPYGEAVYSLMDGLDTPEKLIDARKIIE